MYHPLHQILKTEDTKYSIYADGIKKNDIGQCTCSVSKAILRGSKNNNKNIDDGIVW